MYVKPTEFCDDNWGHVKLWLYGDYKGISAITVSNTANLIQKKMFGDETSLSLCRGEFPRFTPYFP
jgi:hypothetical protein